MKPNNSPVKKAAIYEEFILWSAMPPDQRRKLGMEDQIDFVKVNHINPGTPADWKKRPDFWPRVTALRKEWAMDKTSDIIYGIYRSAMKGNPLSQKLWLQYFLNFAEKSETTVTQKVEISVNDIRFLIEGLPEPQRTKHYANLRDLLIDAEQVRNAGLLEDGHRDESELEPQDPVRGEADNAPQDVQGTKADELASGHQKGLRCDMVGTAQPHHHQGTARWW